MNTIEAISADHNAIQTILDSAAIPSLEHINLDTLAMGNLPVAMVPKTHTMNVLDNLEKHLPHPLRQRGTVILHDADSFVDYVNIHAERNQTSVWMNADFAKLAICFTAVLNDHTPSTIHPTVQAGWRDFTAKFSPVKTEEWGRWVGQDRQKMSQTDFANFIEDNLRDIASIEGMPNGSQILEMALNFEATNDKKFKSATRLQSGGISMEYIDKEDSATLARMSVFDRFALGIRPYLGGDAYRLDARLKYNIREGKLTLWYELIRPDKLIEDAALAISQHIRQQTGLTFYAGNPLLNN